jgi:ABC-2 type transport system permease protein
MTTTAEKRIAAVARMPMGPAGLAPGKAGVAQSFRDIWAYHELLGLLVRRELRARYKDSVLGFLWSLIRPLTMLLVYYVVMGKILGAERVPGRQGGIPSFAIYIFTGLTIWMLFSDILSVSTGTIIGNAGLVKKIYLPREVFPLSVIGSALFNFSIQVGILIVAGLALRQPLLVGNLPYALLALLVVLVYGLALGLFLSAVNVYLRDVQYLVEVILMVLMWASPIIYGWGMIADKVTSPILKNLYLANPVTLSVLGFQRTFWAKGANEAFPQDMYARLLICLGVGLVLLVLGHRVFIRLQGNFAQEL